MITLINAGKDFDRIQHPFMVKINSLESEHSMYIPQQNQQKQHLQEVLRAEKIHNWNIVCVFVYRGFNS